MSLIPNSRPRDNVSCDLPADRVIICNDEADKNTPVTEFVNGSFIDVAKTISTQGVGETLASVGVSNLVRRTTLVVFNHGPQTVFYGTTGVVQATAVPIEKNEFVELKVGDNIQIFLVTNISTSSVTIQEFSR